MTFTPLSGLRVVCLAPLLPGPYAAMVLSDLGADVIAVEHPDGGDPTRRYPGVFEATGRGKRSCALDLKTPAGVEAALRLAESSDAVIEGFRPGTADRLGVGYAAVKARNPRIVYVSISGFGQDGPCRDAPGHDLVYQAASGVLSWGPDGPVMPTLPWADLAAGTFAVAAVAAGVQQAQRTGDGLHVDVPITDVLFSWLGPFLGPLLNGGVWGAPSLPGYNLYRTLDGEYLAFGVTYEDRFWSALCQATGLDQYAEVTAGERAERCVELEAALRERIGSRARQTWEAVLSSHGVPFSPVLRPDEAARSDHIRARRLLTEVDGFVHVQQPLVSPGAARRPLTAPPAVGQHTAEVLGQ